MYVFNRPLLSNDEITYETGKDEPLHPDFMVSSRFIEVGMSDCAYGCKIYADPRSNVKVLGHMDTYGCDVTKEMIDREIERAMYANPDPDRWVDRMVDNAMADLANMLGVSAR